ncbi:MAG TPA: hypothetical protein VE344_06295 [Methylomirabilota bacterium]|nr:hypothetical protein [Methylomirabilota bacterium]
MAFNFCLSLSAESDFDFHAGPLFDDFPLTLDIGHRTEILGPLFYHQQDNSEKTWALPPLFSDDVDPVVESREDDFLYPLLTYERFGTQHRWQLIQLFATSGGADPDNSIKGRVTIFPFYFQQRSTNPEKNYTALIPFYGHLKNRLLRDEIFFVMFPVYGESRKRDVVTDNYLYPFFHLRHGDGLHGWQFWPIIGAEHKIVTTSTNNFGDMEIVGGHDKYFFLWPVHFRQNNGIGTDNPEKIRTDWPLYNILRSPKRDSTSVLWPFFNWIDDREKKYREWEGPYPFVVVARGEGKTTTRVFPLFSRAHSDTFESDFYLWPLYKYNGLHSGALDRRRTRILLFLFQNTADKNKETGAEKRRIDLWPLFVYHRDFNGNNRLQVIAPVESMVPDNRGIERNWSPLWSVWRSENNVKTGASSQSLLWNFYRHEKTPETKKFSFMFGLFQYQADAEHKKFRLFFIPIVNSQKAK